AAGIASALRAHGGGEASTSLSLSEFASAVGAVCAVGVRDALAVGFAAFETAADDGVLTRETGARRADARAATASTAGKGAVADRVAEGGIAAALRSTVGSVVRGVGLLVVEAGLTAAGVGAGSVGVTAFVVVAILGATGLRGAADALAGNGGLLRRAGGSVGGGTSVMSASVVCAAENHDLSAVHS
ncbi:MAG: hypothetical protein ABI866_08745, partial [Dokdonella sp.]